VTLLGDKNLLQLFSFWFTVRPRTLLTPKELRNGSNSGGARIDNLGTQSVIHFPMNTAYNCLRWPLAICTHT